MEKASRASHTLPLPPAFPRMAAYCSSFRLYGMQSSHSLTLAASRPGPPGREPCWEVVTFDRTVSSPSTLSSIIHRHPGSYTEAALSALVDSANGPGVPAEDPALAVKVQQGNTSGNPQPPPTASPAPGVGIMGSFLSVFGGGVRGVSEEVGVPLSQAQDPSPTSTAVPPPYLSAVAFLGAVAFTKGYYLVLVTRSETVGTIGSHVVYAPRAVEVVPVFFEGAHAAGGASLSKWVQDTLLTGADAGTVAEGRYQSLFLFLDLTKDFFFSYTYDLTTPLQYQVGGGVSSSASSPPPPVGMYVWNTYLREEVGLGEGGRHWTVPIIHGFFRQLSLSVFGSPVLLSLLARRSRFFAGARYLKRGADSSGHCANEVESEQIVDDTKGGVSSFMQLRGSVPFHWSQRTSVAVPRPPILVQPRDVTHAPARAHAARLLGRYGSPPLYLNLVKKKEPRSSTREKLVGREMARSVSALNTELPPHLRIQYLSIDYNQVVKSKRHNVLAVLRDVARWSVGNTGFFCNRATPPPPTLFAEGGGMPGAAGAGAVVVLLPPNNAPIQHPLLSTRLQEPYPVHAPLDLPLLCSPLGAGVALGGPSGRETGGGGLTPGLPAQGFHVEEFYRREEEGFVPAPPSTTFSPNYFHGLVACGESWPLRWRSGGGGGEGGGAGPASGESFKCSRTVLSHKDPFPAPPYSHVRGAPYSKAVDFSSFPAWGSVSNDLPTPSGAIEGKATAAGGPSPPPPFSSEVGREEGGGNKKSEEVGEEGEMSSGGESDDGEGTERGEGEGGDGSSEGGGDGADTAAATNKAPSLPSTSSASETVAAAAGALVPSLDTSTTTITTNEVVGGGAKSTSSPLTSISKHLSEEDAVRPDPCRLHSAEEEGWAAASAAGLCRYSVGAGVEGGSGGGVVGASSSSSSSSSFASSSTTATAAATATVNNNPALAARLRDAESLGGEGDYLYINLLGTQGVFVGENGAGVRYQRGVLRTNCVDCLDRTNVAQASVGIHVLGLQLRALGISPSDTLDPSGVFARVLMELFVAHGDAIALQYGGSEANKKMTASSHEEGVRVGDAVERGGGVGGGVNTGGGGGGGGGGGRGWGNFSSSLFSAPQSLAFTLFRYNNNFKLSSSGPAEILTSLQRFYSNSFTDSIKQDAINIFLGVYRPRRVAAMLARSALSMGVVGGGGAGDKGAVVTTTTIDTLSGGHLWEMESDFVLHHPHLLSLALDANDDGGSGKKENEGEAVGALQWYWPGKEWWKEPLDGFLPPSGVSKQDWLSPHLKRDAALSHPFWCSPAPLSGVKPAHIVSPLSQLLLSNNTGNDPHTSSNNTSITMASPHSSSPHTLTSLATLLNRAHLKPHPVSVPVAITTPRVVTIGGAASYTNTQWYMVLSDNNGGGEKAEGGGAGNEKGGGGGGKSKGRNPPPPPPSSQLHSTSSSSLSFFSSPLSSMATRSHHQPLLSSPLHSKAHKQQLLQQQQAPGLKTLAEPGHGLSLFSDVLGHPEKWRVGGGGVVGLMKSDANPPFTPPTPASAPALVATPGTAPGSKKAPQPKPTSSPPPPLPPPSSVATKKSATVPAHSPPSLACPKAFPSTRYPYPTPPPPPPSTTTTEYLMYERHALMGGVIPAKSSRDRTRAYLTTDKRDVDMFRKQLSLCAGVYSVRDLDTVAPHALAQVQPVIPLGQFLAVGLGEAVPSSPSSSHATSPSSPSLPSSSSTPTFASASSISTSTRDFEATQSGLVSDLVSAHKLVGVFQGQPYRKHAGQLLLSLYRGSEGEREAAYREGLFGKGGAGGEGLGHLFSAPVAAIPTFTVVV